MRSPQHLTPCLCSLQVSAAAREALATIGAAVRNPEVRAASDTLIRAIADPVKQTRPALETLRDTVFVHVVDVSSLALILPVITRGMKERGGEAKKAAALILGNLVRCHEPDLALVCLHIV